MVVHFFVALLIPGSRSWLTPVAVIAKLVDIVFIYLLRLVPTDTIWKQTLRLVLVGGVVGFARVVILLKDRG